LDRLHNACIIKVRTLSHKLMYSILLIKKYFFLLLFAPYTAGINLYSNRINVHHVLNHQPHKHRLQIRKQIVTSLVTLAKLKLKTRRHSAIFIPTTNPFWHAMPLPCTDVALMVPALSGIALIHGFPPKQCLLKHPHSMFFAYTSQHINVALRHPLKPNKASVCKYAKHKGFAQVYAFKPNGTYTLWHC
jgi:hypothetical protein